MLTKNDSYNNSDLRTGPTTFHPYEGQTNPFYGASRTKHLQFVAISAIFSMGL